RQRGFCERMQASYVRMRSKSFGPLRTAFTAAVKIQLLPGICTALMAAVGLDADSAYGEAEETDAVAFGVAVELRLLA
ncbi:hypothetical protein PL81_03040, partial [Streptomyces sp. RSD-27]